MTLNRHGQTWFIEEDRRVYDAFAAGENTDSIARSCGRSKAAIRARLKKLGLVDLYGDRVLPVPTYKALKIDKHPIAHGPHRPRQEDDGPVIPPLPAEKPFEWPQHGCLPIATWFVAQTVEALREHVDESARRALLVHLGWGSGKAPWPCDEIAGLFCDDRKKVKMEISRAVRRLGEMIRAGHRGLWPAHMIARSMLLFDGAVDRQRLVLLSDTMFGSSASDGAGLLWVLAEPERDFFQACRLVKNQRGRMQEERGKPRMSLRLARRWGLLWLGAWLPRYMNIGGTLSDLTSGPVRAPSPESVGKTGKFESHKSGHALQFESKEEERIFDILKNAPEVTAFGEQPMLIERDDVGYGYCPDVAVMTCEKIPVIVEVKPQANMTGAAVLQKALAALRFASKVGCVYMMVDRLGHSLLDFFAHSVPGEVRASVHERLEGRASLSFRECAKCLEHVPRSDWRKVMNALAVQDDLSFSVLPRFRVSRLPEGLRWSDLVRAPVELAHPVGLRGEAAESLVRLYF
jgi:hypothetical protein